MDIDEICRIIKTFETGYIKELEVEKDGTRLRLVKPEMMSVSPGSAASLLRSDLEQRALESGSSAREGGLASQEPESDDAIYYMKSPIVGTFYRAPAPGAEPFVDIGDKVKKGQILCIVEAMKLMNEIEAETSGEIVQVYVENSQPVEYGQRLFAIRVG